MKIGKLKLSGLSLIGLVALLIWFAASVPALVRGISLRHSLLKEISEAKSIEVVEHSCMWDHSRNYGQKYVEKVYSRVVLNPAQTTRLRRTLFPSVDYSGMSANACIFEPHHRVVVTRADNSVFTMEVCFICGDIAINKERKRIFPVGWDSSLRSFISSLSMRPDGPWR